MILVAGPYRSGTKDDPTLIARNVAAMTDTALRLFSERGYLGVRVEDIAKESGVSRATFYKHFAEREQVLAEIVGSQRMCPGRTLKLGGEIDIVDRHRPDERAQRDDRDQREQDAAACHGKPVAAETAPSLLPRRRRAALTRRGRDGRRRVSGKRCGGRASHK